MHYCHNCGNQIPDNIKFCPHCGASQSAPNPQYQGEKTQMLQPRGQQKSSSATIYWVIAAVLITIAAGLLVFLLITDDKPEQKPVAEQTAPAKTETVVVKEKEVEKRAPGEPANGKNKLSGTFHFDGADYPISITFNYNASSGSCTKGVYYGSGNTVPISSMTVTPYQVEVTGPEMYIYASSTGTPGTYYGDLTRGDHTGTCTLKLQ